MVIPNLMLGFGIDEIQAEFIAEIKLRNINKEYILTKIDEKEQLIKELARLKKILKSPDGINNLIKEQLKEIAKKYGKPRLTEVIHEDDVTVVTKDELIEDYNIKLYLTHDGYFKKIPLTSLRSSPEQKVKEDDYIVHEADWHNKSEIIFISSKQTVYKMKIHDLPDCKASSFGEYMPNVLGTDEDERIISFVVTDNYDGHILFAFENGKISNVPLSAYETKTNRKKLINAYGAASPLVDAIHISSQETEIAVSSSNDRIIVFPASMVPVKSTKSTQGVSVLKLKKGCVLKYIKKASDAEFANNKVYRIKAIPAAGAFIKSTDV